MKKQIEVNLGELFNRFLESKKEENTIEIPVGTVSKETVLKFKNWKREKSMLDDEIELEEEKITKEFKRRMLDLFEDQTLEMMEKKRAIWEDIYNELGIEKNENDTFVINAITGEVTKEIKKNDLFGNKSHGLQ
jgi:hypothetical protein